MEFDHKKIWWYDHLYEKLHSASNITKFNLGRKLFNRRAITYLSIEDNNIEAVIFDGKKKYYEVGITISMLEYSSIERIRSIFLNDTHKCIDLINGVFRKDLYDELEGSGISLFFSWDDMNHECSCKKTKKCEHKATVLHRILNEIIYEPMLLFNLRGIEKDLIYSIIMNDPDFELDPDDIPASMTFDYYSVGRKHTDNKNIDPIKYYGTDFEFDEKTKIKTSNITRSKVFQGKIREEFYEIYDQLSEHIKINAKKY